VAKSTPPHDSFTEPFGLAHAVVLLDASGRIVAWSAGAAALTGLAAEEALGEPYATLFSEPDRKLDKPTVDLTLAVHEGARRQTWRRRRRDGTLFWADTSLTSVRGEGGVLMGFVEIGREVDEPSAPPEE
jgi:PAS domain S-box-containing protein